jgi:hypothetical protein
MNLTNCSQTSRGGPPEEVVCGVSLCQPVMDLLSLLAVLCAAGA